MGKKRNYETVIKRRENPKDLPLAEQESDYYPGDQELLQLEGTEWSANQWAFIVWEATPIPVRLPTTINLLAGKLGITARTLFNWRKLPKFREQVRSIARRYLEQDLPSIYYALSDQAQRGSYPHIKLALELVGDYQEHYDITSGNKPIPITTYNYNAAITALTEGPTSGSTPSSQD